MNLEQKIFNKDKEIARLERELAEMLQASQSNVPTAQKSQKGAVCLDHFEDGHEAYRHAMRDVT